jgi:hypothetical protein
MNKPSWYPYVSQDRQAVYNWLEVREPEIAGWWDGYSWGFYTKFAWKKPEIDEEDVVLVLRNKDQSVRNIAYKLVENNLIVEGVAT